MTPDERERSAGSIDRFLNASARYGTMPGFSFTPYGSDVDSCIDGMELQMLNIRP